MYAVVALLTLMFITWGAAVWASYREEPEARIPETAHRHLKAA